MGAADGRTPHPHTGVTRHASLALRCSESARGERSVGVHAHGPDVRVSDDQLVDDIDWVLPYVDGFLLADLPDVGTLSVPHSGT